MATAVLSGNVLDPVLAVKIPFAEQELKRRVRSRTGCWWEQSSLSWRLTGPHVRQLCRSLSIAIDDSGVDYSVEEASTPIVYPHPSDTSRVIINPRLSGPDHVTRLIAPYAHASSATGWVDADALDLADRNGEPLGYLAYEQGCDNRVREQWEKRVATPRTTMTVNTDAELLARSFDPDDKDAAAALERLSSTHPLPKGFGLGLYPYQVMGAQAAAESHRLIADVMGTGKMRSSLAVAAILGSKRIVVIAPPAVQTQWCLQVCDAHLARILPKQGVARWAKDIEHPTKTMAGRGASIVQITPGRKAAYELPDMGVVVVTDSLLVSRKETLVAQLTAWAPDMVIVDEAHRQRVWTSARSQVTRNLIHQARTINTDMCVLALTGTPTPSGSPTDLAPLLDMLGMLDVLFGGLGNFVRTYAKPKFFGGFEPNPDMADKLNDVMNRWLKVFRGKDDVLPWLPAKTRTYEPIDGSTAEFKKSVVKVEAAVTTWATSVREKTGCWPSSEDVDQWSRDHASLGSALRIGAGLAKIDWCVDLVCSRLDNQQLTAGENGLAQWEEPQVIWCWHKDVMEQVSSAIAKRSHPSGEPYSVVVLDGSTSASVRGQTVQQIQNRTLPVTVCQIAAMGVGVTMTACHSPVFLETDWLPDLNIQAEDRHHREGQKDHVQVTVGWAPDTTDDHLFAVAAEKARATASISGVEAEPWPHPDVSVTGLLTEIAVGVVAKLSKQKP